VSGGILSRGHFVCFLVDEIEESPVAEVAGVSTDSVYPLDVMLCRYYTVRQAGNAVVYRWTFIIVTPAGA